MVSKRDIGNLHIKVGMDSVPFREGVTNVNRELKKMESEFKLSNATLGSHGKELDKLKLKSTNLSKQTELQKQKVAMLEEAHRKSVETKGKDAKATQLIETELNNAKRQLVYMEKELKSTNTEIDKQSSNWYKMGQELDKTGNKMQETGMKMQKLGADMTKYVTVPLVGIGAASLKIGMDFEASMSEVQAISGATGDDLQQLENIAREMGSTTKYSANEAAQGLKYMSLAGWDTHQMTAALPDVLNLAAAANMDLARASDVVTDTMSAFQMEATEAGKATDIFATTASKSNTDINQLAEAMKYAGASANAAGMDLAQTNAVLGIFADSGIKGSQAGTTFNAMLRDLRNNAEDGAIAVGDTAVAVYDAEGNMRDLGAIMADVELATKDMTTAQRDMAMGAIFGEQAIRGANIMLATGAEAYYDLEEAIYASEGAAQKMADTMSDNAKGNVESLKSAMGELALIIYDVLVPWFTKLVEKLTDLARWFGNLDEGTQRNIIRMGAMAAVTGPAINVFGRLTTITGGVTKALGKLSIGMAGKTTATAAATKASTGLIASQGLLAKSAIALTGPVGLTAAAITGCAVAGVALHKNWDNLNEKYPKLMKTLSVTNPVVGAVNVFNKFQHAISDSIQATVLFDDSISEMTQESIGNFMELNDEANLTLKQLSWSMGEVSEESATVVTNNFSKMAEDVQAGLKAHHEKSLGEMENFFNSSKGLSEKEQQEILNNMEQGYQDRSQVIADGEIRIKEIMDSASKEKRALTKAEQQEINAIQQNMVETGLQVLTENELETKVIMERMKANAGEMSALQAAEVVQNSIEQKEGAIAAAEEQYNDVMREIIRQRDEAGSISEEQADKLIAEAKRQKRESIANAEQMHQAVVDEAKKQADEHVNHVNWETGEVLKNWQVMVNNTRENIRNMSDNMRSGWNNMKANTAESWNNIRNSVNSSLNNMRDTTREVTSNISSTMQARWGEVRSSTASTWQNVSKSVADSMQNVRNRINEGLQSIREWNMAEVKEKTFSITERVTRIFSGDSADVASNFQGTNFFKGGLTMVGEMGPELVELPRGSKIHSDHKTEQMFNGTGSITQHITINSPTPLSPSEVARKTKQASRQLALEW